MSEKTKKVLIVVVAVLAVAGAVFSGMKFTGEEKVWVDNRIAMPPGYKSEKALALEGQSDKATPDKGAEKDLSK